MIDFINDPTGYWQRKKERTLLFDKIKGKKLVICTACSGSGYYDTCIRGRVPKCASCEGTGKVREK